MPRNYFSFTCTECFSSVLDMMNIYASFYSKFWFNVVHIINIAAGRFFSLFSFHLLAKF
jgi:hypothetical protein